MKTKNLKKKLFLIMFLIGIISMPLISEVVTAQSDAWAIAAANGYGSAEGAIIVGTITNVGWAMGWLCGVQLVGAIIVSG